MSGPTTGRSAATTNTVPRPTARLVSLATAAETIGVSTKTLRRRISDGTVRGYRIVRLVRVDLDELRDALVVPIPSAR